MYELAIALRYLWPRWRQLSVSIISLISIAVIALVVWLIVVFFSVTHGLERNWLQKLLTLAAPIRITPTEEYYRSYYYLVDSISAQSDYTLKSIGEKLSSPTTNPYNPEIDGAPPSDWLEADTLADGSLKDTVKELFNSIEAIKDSFSLSAYESILSRGNLYISFMSPQGPVAVEQEVFISSWERGNNDIAFLDKLPSFSDEQEGVILPKSFRDVGIQVGDKGSLSYRAATASALRTQQIETEVVGFYDPGIIPMGGKFILTRKEVAAMARSGQQHEEAAESNAVHITFEDLSQTEKLQQAIKDELQKRGIASHWKVESYQDLPHAKDLLRQLASERRLFSLLAAIIIAVACSNIVSMLIILVNDKKQEIGILRAMGARAFSIALIFGTCGVAMGITGSLLGITIALLTLNNLQSVVDFLSALQGQELLDPIFYGDQLPTALSGDALIFAVTATAILSLISGIVPAMKATFAKPAELLRTE